MRRVKLSPTEEYEGRLAAAVALRQLGDFYDALQQLRRAAKLKPDGDQAALLLGLTLHEMGQLPAAEKELRRACKLASESEEASLALGMLLLARGKHAAAARRLKPIAADVNNSSARRAYADALAQTPRGLARAISVLEESFAHSPQDDELAIQLAELLQKGGDHQRALSVLEPFAESAPEPGLLRLLSDLYSEAGKVDRALEAARHAAELEPGQIDLWLNLVFRSLAAQQPGEALRAASKAVELDTHSALAWLASAAAHAACEKWTQALSDIEHVIRLVEPWVNENRLLSDLRSLRTGYLLRVEGVDAALAQVTADLELDPDSESLRELQARLLSLKLGAQFDPPIT